MAKFQYKMQNILDVKLNLESQAKQEFGQAIVALVEEQQKYTNLEERLKAYMKQLTDSVSGSIDVLEIQLAKNGVSITKESMKQQLAMVRSAERNVENKRKKLESLIQERKTQEKLKEKAFEEFMQELNQQEQKEVDELVSYRYGQKTIEE